MEGNNLQGPGILNSLITVCYVIKAIWRQINVYLARADISTAVCLVVEFVKYCLESAYSVRNKFLENDNTIPDDFIFTYIVPVVRRYQDATYYTYSYVLPSFQFTALFQVAGVGFGLFRNGAYTATKLTMFKGGVKASCSLLIIVKGKVAKGEDIKGSDFVMPFSKEPVVSLCKVVFSTWVPGLPTIIHKFPCNLLGEVSHNTAKYAFGRQKLSYEELSWSMPVKSVVKTLHQEIEAGLTHKLWDVIGFYVGSFIPRSWANDFVEEVATGNLLISDINLISNITYYTATVVAVAGAAHCAHALHLAQEAVLEL